MKDHGFVGVKGSETVLVEGIGWAGVGFVFVVRFFFGGLYIGFFFLFFLVTVFECLLVGRCGGGY